MSVFSLKVNGQAHKVDVDPTTPLLYVLSDDLQLNGPKFGCGLGQCGACTAIVNGRAVRTCRTPMSTMNGACFTPRSRTLLFWTFKPEYRDLSRAVARLRT